MRFLFLSFRFFAIFLFFFYLAAPLSPQCSDRYFDKAEIFSDDIRLAAFYPVDFAVRILDELRKQDFLTVENLVVIGIFFENELTDYKAAMAYTEKNNIKWFKFHRVSGDLNPGNLFKKNGCSAEFEHIFAKSDGILFFGGADIPPQIYGDKTNLLTAIETPFRHYIELSFIFHLLGGFQDRMFTPLLDSRPDFPVLGICLGCQSLNVGTGGTLSQDIWSDVYGIKYFEDVISLETDRWHRNPYTKLYPEKNYPLFLMHPIRLLEEGKFCTELDFDPKDRPYVSSAHHQTINSLGKGLKPTATSLDGKIIEAVEHREYPNILGVQFHPEMPWLWDDTVQIKFMPDEGKTESYRSILDKNPPSFNFHKKIWHWFSDKLNASFNKRKKSSERI